VRRLQEWWPVPALTGEPSVVTDDGHHAKPPAGPARLAVALGVVVLVVLVDQLTKWWAVDRLPSGPVHVIWRLDFSLSYNTGSAFSLFQNATGILVVVAVVLVGVLLVLVWRAPTLGRAAILGLILGGALGNLSDRFFRGQHGAVVDFVDFHFFPTFNVADSCITVGCILLILSILLDGRRA
jgi:signal peptidase II